jgi:hypothetical protein
MNKEDWNISDRCYHRNLQEGGVISSFDTGDPSSIFVEFDDGEELEVSVHLLDKVYL